MSTADGATVLVVEDEPDVAETYEIWLGDRYDVRRAATGEEALAMLDEDVDVVLLDRMMPEMSGDEVLTEMRERGHECWVAMVSAVDPDFDIIEMGFDRYVSKPPQREELIATVESLLDSDRYAGEVREFRSLLAKRSALLEEKSEGELARSEAFSELEREIETRRAALEAGHEQLLDDAAFVSTLRNLVGERDDGGGTET